MPASRKRLPFAAADRPAVDSVDGAQHNDAVRETETSRQSRTRASRLAAAADRCIRPAAQRSIEPDRSPSSGSLPRTRRCCCEDPQRGTLLGLLEAYDQARLQAAADVPAAASASCLPTTDGYLHYKELEYLEASGSHGSRPQTSTNAPHVVRSASASLKMAPRSTSPAATSPSRRSTAI